MYIVVSLFILYTLLYIIYLLYIISELYITVSILYISYTPYYFLIQNSIYILYILLLLILYNRIIYRCSLNSSELNFEV